LQARSQARQAQKAYKTMGFTRSPCTAGSIAIIATITEEPADIPALSLGFYFYINGYVKKPGEKMTSLKKQSKRLLSEIQESANQLALLTSDLTLLEDTHELAVSLKTNVETLNRQLAGLKKAEFNASLADSEILEILDELIDNDPISTLEQRLFAAQPDHESGEVGEFFQQLLDKVEKLYTPLLSSIQQLTAMPDKL
jgi:hypothetical protein